MITLSGGVACNKALQSALGAAAKEAGMTLFLTPPALTTDNAGMIAFAGLLSSENRDADSLTIGIDPNLSLTA